MYSSEGVGGYAARDRQSLYRPASVRFLHRWPLDFTIGDNLMSQHLYIPQRWHHVVAQKNGNRIPHATTWIHVD